ncbi:hypothetical protein [Myroides odoratimimus]|uniref:hypothetical protein n=1 Tax=Myroides odoratimimus TaxID=76832 RepID=UPI002DBBDFEE|nr:hypothetical protein [Myroides odoratimimus]MEC4028945.1 hypothetical protein [Myroides odoratimimus]
MSNNGPTYIAVSSDARELYKADIYRVLVKPNKSIEHFRYQKKWIVQSDSNTDCITSKKLINKEVIIVFKITKHSDPEYIPIRKAIIKNFEYDEETEIYHYYFELQDFCEVINLSNIIFDDNKFFYNFSKVYAKKIIWKDIIEKVKSHFPDKIFYKIDKLVSNSDTEINLIYNAINHSYSYPLTQGTDYSLFLSIANPNNAKSNLTIESSTTDLNVILTPDYSVTVPYDKIKIPITTKYLDSFKEKSYLSFYLKNDENDVKFIKEYENHIHVIKKMNIIRPVKFGVLSTLLIALTWLIKDKTTQLENIFCCECTINWATVIYLIGIFIVSSILLASYNKK